MTLGNKNLPITYREYKFAEEFPILLMEGKSTSPQIDFIHFHNCIEIAFCRKGTMTWNLENRIFSLTPGNICFLPPFFTCPRGAACCPRPGREIAYLPGCLIFIIPHSSRPCNKLSVKQILRNSCRFEVFRSPSSF